MLNQPDILSAEVIGETDRLENPLSGAVNLANGELVYPALREQYL